MRSGKAKRSLALIAGPAFLLAVCGVVVLRITFSRSREFQARARVGDSIVQAIEAYRKRTGVYPVSLAELAPRDLASLPAIRAEESVERGGWEYRRVTNGAVVSFRLRSYMGRGGVEHEPPRWIGNDEGRRFVLFIHE